MKGKWMFIKVANRDKDCTREQGIEIQSEKERGENEKYYLYPSKSPLSIYIWCVILRRRSHTQLHLFKTRSLETRARDSHGNCTVFMQWTVIVPWLLLFNWHYNEWKRFDSLFYYVCQTVKKRKRKTKQEKEKEKPNRKNSYNSMQKWKAARMRSKRVRTEKHKAERKNARIKQIKSTSSSEERLTNFIETSAKNGLIFNFGECLVSNKPSQWYGYIVASVVFFNLARNQRNRRFISKYRSKFWYIYMFLCCASFFSLGFAALK